MKIPLVCFVLIVVLAPLKSIAQDVPTGAYILGDKRNAPTGYKYSGTYLETPGTNTWNGSADLSGGRGSAATTVLGRELYLIGGFDGASNLGSVIAYDPDVNAWTIKASLLTARQIACATVAKGKIYVFGGFNGSTLASVEEYDPATNAWSGKAAMPGGGRAYLGCATAKGKVYVIGGAGAAGSNEEYDPTTNTWVTRAPMPFPRFGQAVVEIDGKVHCISGVDTSGQVVSSHDIYDPSTDQWTSGTPIPTPRYLPSFAVINRTLFVVGGWAHFNADPIAKAEAYDDSSKGWKVLTDMPTARYAPAAGGIDKKVYVVGGYDNTGPQIKNEAFDPIFRYYVHEKK